MYPPQTSFIPVQVALARFLESQGWRGVLGHYPYWYLGTTPFRYLTGPILPIFAGLFHRLFPFLNLFEIMFGVIGVCWIVGAVGVCLLVASLANSFTSERRSPPSEECIRPPRRRFALMAAFFYLFGPIVPFLFRFSDGRYLVAFSFLPLVLWQYLKLLKNWTTRQAVLVVFLITFVILIDTLILPSLILGMAAILLAIIGWNRAEKVLKKSCLLIAVSCLLATAWYTPGYWLRILLAPSFGGKGALMVIEWLGKLLPTVLALTMAVFSVKFFKKKNPLRDFCFYWLFIFGFLTLIRFLSDPDFWLDWLAYGLELQMGLAIALALLVKTKIKNLSILAIILTSYFLLLTSIFKNYVIGTLQKDITQTVEYKIGQELVRVVKPGEKVFLSGTTAFWLNALSASWRIPQVRGGVDQAAVDKDWRKAVWEIREGPSASSGLEWLRKLGVNYLVIHSRESAEFYHDFVYPEKFEGIKGLEKIYDQEGDRIYRVEF